MTKWDPSLHPHGVHGHWATVGGTKGGRKKVDRSAENRYSRNINAFKPRKSAAEARTEKERVPSKVRDINAIYRKHEAGTATFSDKEKISWSSPQKRAEQTRKTGSPIKSKADAIHTARSYARQGIADDRTSIKKTFTGKKIVVRGDHKHMDVPVEGRPGSTHMVFDRRVRRAFADPKSARKLMSAKPAASPAHKQYTRSQLTLKSDAWMRDQLAARGVAIPKGARTKVLVALLAGD